MSGNLESLVRPFESERSTPQPYYTPGQQTVPNIKMMYGRGGGGGKVINGSINSMLTVYCERHEVEKEMDAGEG